MRLFRSWPIFLFCIVFQNCQPDETNWQPLLQDNLLSDFEILNGSANYSLDGNIITGTTALNSPNTFLATKKHYDDFELKFDVRLSEGLNSGVQIRSISDSSIMDGRVHGYQVEIENSPRGWAGGIYDEARRGWLYPLERNAKGRKAFRKGEWNTYHILARGDTLMTWVNGIPCAHLVDSLTSSGLIGLQVHSIGDSAQVGKTIQWRNIQIKTEGVGEGLADWPQAPQATLLPAHSNSTEEFILQPGFYIHQLAAEPQVQSPMASALDEQGNIWVVELPGYMRDIDGSEEDKPDGKIVVLSDINKDGLMDRRELYKDQLVAPRAICLAYNGLLYNNGRALYFDDFKTGETTLVDSFYVQGGNIEHQPNGLYFNIDNWIYSAKSNRRYRFRNGNWEKEATTLRGQWGMNADEHGRLVYNDNSNGLQGDRVLPNTLIDNHYLRSNSNLLNQLCTDNRVYPYQATAVNRGYMENVLDDSGKLLNFTSSCSPIIYKGTGSLKRNAFTCAPEVNLIKRYVLKTNTPFSQDYKQAYQDKEFLISTDETFRPVNIYNNPTGGMLMVDLRKGVIQHRAYMTHYLREIILDRKLDQVVGKGRLYLVNESKDRPKDLAMWPKNLSLEQKVKLLAHENGSLRLAMQKHLIADNDLEAVRVIEKLLDGKNDLAKIHALWTLEGMEQLKEEHLTAASKSSELVLNYHLLAIMDANRQLINPSILYKAYLQKHEELDLILCHLLSPKDRKMINDLKQRYSNSPAHAESLLARYANIIRPERYPQNTLQKTLAQMLENKSNNRQVSPTIITHQYSDNRNEGFPAYSKYCASCHGHDGIGQPNLAPPLLYSQYIEGKSDKLAALILQGLQGPITVNGEKYDMNLVMPGLKQNPEITDEVVSAIIAFVNNAFSEKGKGINAEGVAEVRAKLEGRDEPLTEEEVLRWE